MAAAWVQANPAAQIIDSELASVINNRAGGWDSPSTRTRLGR